MLRKAGNGGHFVSPISKQNTHIVGFAYVDDTDLIQIDMRNIDNDTEEVMRKMQEAIDRWEGGLKTTGGAIVPSKSWVCPIDFSFDHKGKWKYKPLDEINFEFTVKNEFNDTTELKTLDPSTGMNTLGVTLAPDGNNTKAVEELRQKSQKWKDLVDTGYLKGSDVYLALHSTIYKSLQYLLPALTLTEKECRWIASPMLSAGLSGSRINRNFPRDVLFGSTSDGGIGMWNLYNYQCISEISFLIEHINEDNISGELIRCSIEAALI